MGNVTRATKVKSQKLPRHVHPAVRRPASSEEARRSGRDRRNRRHVAVHPAVQRPAFGEKPSLPPEAAAELARLGGGVGGVILCHAPQK